MSTRGPWIVLLVAAAASSCTPDPFEGSEPGDCSDGADNDRDGLFDCLDPGCEGAPACRSSLDGGTDGGPGDGGAEDAAMADASRDAGVDGDTPTDGGVGGTAATHVWSIGFDGEMIDFAVGPLGSIYVVGTFDDVVDFGGGPLGSVGAESRFLASFAADGAHRWSVVLAESYVNAVDVDTAERVYVAGLVDRGPSAIPDQYSSVRVFDSAGNEVWSRMFEGASGWQLVMRPADIAMDADGNAYVIGTITEYQFGQIDFGGGFVTVSPDSVVVVALDPTGAFRWFRNYSAGTASQGLSVDVDGDGDVHFLSCGAVIDCPGFEAGAYSLVSLTNGGECQWSIPPSTGPGALYTVTALSAAAAGAHLVGDFEWGGDDLTYDFGSGPVIPPMSHSAGYEVARGGGGEFVSFRQSLEVDMSGVAVDATGGSVVVGAFGRETDLGAGPMGDFGWFAAGYDVAGTYRWHYSFESGPRGLSRSSGCHMGLDGLRTNLRVGLGPAGEVYVGGAFAGGADLGGGALPTSGGFFLMRLASP